MSWKLVLILEPVWVWAVGGTPVMSKSSVNLPDDVPDPLEWRVDALVHHVDRQVLHEWTSLGQLLVHPFGGEGDVVWAGVVMELVIWESPNSFPDAVKNRFEELDGDVLERRKVDIP